MRIQVILVCTACNRENYFSDKNKKSNQPKISLQKYCGQCRKTIKHLEKRKK